MGTNIIDPLSPAIVCTERKIEMTDVKLKSLLSATYERANKNFKFITCRDVCSGSLSISVTLFLALLTSSFNSIGPFSAEKVTFIVKVICILSLCLGVGLWIKQFVDKNMCDTDDREAAVQKIIDKNLPELKKDILQEDIVKFK